MKRLLFALVALTCVSVSHAADHAAPGVIETPGEDVFGFSSGADVGKPGDRALALETDGVFGARLGHPAAMQKLEFSRTFADNWSYAGSLFGAWTSLRNHPDFETGSAYGFDGASIELRHRLVERSPSQPFAVTLGLEPRWSRIDGFSGRSAAGYGVEFKAQVDAPVSDRLFWAGNLVIGTSRSRDPLERAWSNATDTSASTALAYAAVEDRLWIGAEARWEHAWAGALAGGLEGQAFYVGPTIAYKPAPSMALNLVVLPQVAGRARGAGGNLDLDHFERAKIRLKAVVGF